MLSAKRPNQINSEASPLITKIVAMEDDPEVQPPKVWVIGLIAGLIPTFWLLNLLYGLSYGQDDNQVARAGQFGDMFGAVNALFSGFALVGVVYAIVMQRYEIALTKSELKESKRILAEQQKNNKTQNDQQKIAAFENTFFRMLELFSNITNHMDIQKTDGTATTGKDVFNILFRRLTSAYRGSRSHVGDIDSWYNTFYDSNNFEIGHYFRLMYNIVNFVDKADVDGKNAFYVKILRAQLSDTEVAILFYNGISVHGRNNFKPLIEKYGLLKNLDNRYVLDASLKSSYSSTAYGGRAAVLLPHLSPPSPPPP